MKKVNLTIAIPAYNEANTIENILYAIFSQNDKKYNLKNVFIYNDGSDDETSTNLYRLKKRYKKITIKNYKVRKGKNFRLNQMFKEINSNILVILDADINFSGKDYINKLINPLIKNKKIIMSASCSVPLRPSNFLGKLVYQSFINWDYIKANFNQKDNVHNFGGQATAYKKGFYKKLKIPSSISEERYYIYNMAKKVDGFHYNKEAITYFWPVSTLTDIVNLTHREFGNENSEIYQSLGIDTQGEIRIPIKNKVRGILEAFWESPFYAPMALVLNVLLAHARPKKVSTKKYWEISTSTKKGIEFQK